MKKSFLLGVFLFLLPGFCLADAQSDFAAQMETFLQKDENIEKIGEALQQFYQKKQKEDMMRAAKEREERVEKQFENPVDVDISGAPVRGKKDAKITIVEFSDFQCPFCGRGAKVVEEVLKMYPNDVKLVFMNLPLPFHPEARSSALAALAAGEQGKYWEMHDLLFENQQQLGENSYVNFANQLKLDIEKFNTDRKSEKLAKRIEAEMAQAQKLGVQGTPGFFINGVQLEGAQPLPKFKEIVDKWLTKLK